MPVEKIVVLSGSGISAESGLATFRDAGGLWEGYDINEVASIEGWYSNPRKVLDFYNLRREQAAMAMPNAAHKALSKLEQQYEVVVITQNVDDLHERGGSTNVLHLHGELRKARSERNPDEVIDIGSSPIRLGDKSKDGTQLRPAIVWFGEMVPMIERAAVEVSAADIFLVIGTSLAVYPAAGLTDYAPLEATKYIVDPSVPGLLNYHGWTHIQKNANEGVPELVEELINRIR